MPWWGVLIIIAVIVAAAGAALYFIGKKTEKKQAEQQAQIEAAKQNVTLLVIDKKKVKLKDAGFPDIVLQQTPKLFRGRKFYVVKGRVNTGRGAMVSSFICDKDVFEIIPVKKEVKATVSGLYITSVKAIRGSLETPAKSKKKSSKLEELLRKGRGEA
ncbi:MAG: hypothetical protein K5744_09615 [Eubacterium sp.]|jgi:hypothetical protein|uniref:Uncharacterized protein n=1 Tax=Eubacterium cellulosolvens (strain ATCC 43171 / JCM 9499 / 6) TaxID=633697 RepID=I5AUK5_EUBC6|nr:hypothetical protein [Eubacterium sp.]